MEQISVKQDVYLLDEAAVEIGISTPRLLELTASGLIKGWFFDPQYEDFFPVCTASLNKAIAHNSKYFYQQHLECSLRGTIELHNEDKFELTTIRFMRLDVEKLSSKISGKEDFEITSKNLAKKYHLNHSQEKLILALLNLGSRAISSDILEKAGIEGQHTSFGAFFKKSQKGYQIINDKILQKAENKYWKIVIPS